MLFSVIVNHLLCSLLPFQIQSAERAQSQMLTEGQHLVFSKENSTCLQSHILAVYLLWNSSSSMFSQSIVHICAPAFGTLSHKSTFSPALQNYHGDKSIFCSFVLLVNDNRYLIAHHLSAWSVLQTTAL